MRLYIIRDDGSKENIYKEFAMANCLVTGGAGFVGSHLAEKLVHLGHKVLVLDDLRSGYMRNLRWCMDEKTWSDVSRLGFSDADIRMDLGLGMVFYKGSVTDASLLASVFHEHKIQAVFHLAAIVSVPYSVSHEEETYAINLQGTQKVLEAAAAAGCTTMVHAGSAAEYGDRSPVPAPEAYVTGDVEQQSPYGKTKYMAGRHVADASGLRGVSLRFFNIYGPRQDPASQYSGVISKFMACAAKGEDLPVCGDGEQTRDFVFVGDVVRAYLCAAGLGGSAVAAYTGERIFNVGGGSRISVNELAEAVIRVSGTSGRIKHVAERPGDIRHSCADISRARHGIGWEPEVPLKTGLEITYDWYKVSM